MLSRSRSIACLTLALVMPLGMAGDAVTDLASDQARYWAQRGRQDLAAEAWQKVLRIEPGNTAALAGLAMAEIRAGRPEQARPHVQALRKLSPADPALAQLEALLGNAAAANVAGPADTALDASGSRESAAPSRAALTRTAAGQGSSSEPAPVPAPADAAPADALDAKVEAARQLTLRLNSRRQGLEQLMVIANDPVGRFKAQPAWRQALLWMNGKGGSARYFEAYLQTYGEDATLRRKLAAAQAEEGAVADAGPARAGAAAPAPASRAGEVRRGWSLIEAGDIEGAEQIFAAHRQLDLRDAEAVAGLATVRQRQERHEEALALFEEASRLAPGRWRTALARARFEQELGQARKAAAAGQAAEAERQLRKLLGSSAQAGKDPAVRLALAEALVAQQQFTEAESIYRDVLRKHRGDVDAARGLIGLLTQSDRAGDALALYRTFSAEQQAQVGGLPTLQSLALRQQALMAKDAARSEELLRQALAIDPLGTWPRLDLARLYLTQKRRDDARSLIQGLPQSGPRAGEAAYIRGLFAAEEGNWYDALIWFEQVPEAQRSAEMAAEQQRLWVRYQVERAEVQARQGYRDKAVALLGEIAPYASTPELISALAEAYAEAGETAKALNLLRQEIAKTVDASVEIRLAYARLLLRLGQHVEFEAQVEQLTRRPGLVARQEAEIAQLRNAYRLSQAAALREAGDLERAHEVLHPSILESPQDPRVLIAVGRLHEAAGEHERARSLYLQALEREPGIVDGYQGMVRACLLAGRKDEADRWMAEALRIEPDNSQLYDLAAQLAKARGEDGRAKQYLRKAVELRPGGREATPGRLGPRLQLLDPQLRPISSSAERAAYASPRSGVST